MINKRSRMRREIKRFDWIFQSSAGDSTNSEANCTDEHSRLTNTYAVDVPGKPIPFAAVQRYPPSFVLLVISSSSLLSSDRITDWLPSVVQVTFGAGFPDVRHVSVMVSLWLTVTFPGMTWAVGWSIDKRFEKCIPSKSSLIFYWSWLTTTVCFRNVRSHHKHARCLIYTAQVWGSLQKPSYYHVFAFSTTFHFSEKSSNTTSIIFTLNTVIYW